MYEAVLDQLAAQKIVEAEDLLIQIESKNNELDNEYQINLFTLLRAYILQSKGDNTASIETTNSVSSYFKAKSIVIDHILTLPTHPLAGLENIFIDILWSKSLAGLNRFSEARGFLESAFVDWKKFDFIVEHYRLPSDPHPFILALKVQILALRLRISKSLDSLSDAKEAKCYFIEEFEKLFVYSESLGEHYTDALNNAKKEFRKDLENPSLLSVKRSELLSLLTPEWATLNPSLPSDNGINSNNPLISVCIAAYKEGEWLKLTIDSILERAQYDNFEVIIVLQKDGESDLSGDFLFSSPYSEDKRIKVFTYLKPLGSEGGKDTAVNHAQGDIICAFDSHVIPAFGFLKLIAHIFSSYREINVMVFGMTYTDSTRIIGITFYDEIPYELNGVVGCRSIQDSAKLQHYKDGLLFRHSLLGGGYVITKSCYKEVYGYELLPNYGWGDKLLGMGCYLYGYTIFCHLDLIAIHRYHEDHSSFWTDSTRKTGEFEYQIEVVANALRFGYCYFSSNYFQTHFMPWIESLAQDNFEIQYRIFEADIPKLNIYREKFWKGARRSIKDYWEEYWDFIWPHLQENERIALTRGMILE
jgi:glycosyltransferase involved in cell wall biosynthesis